MGKNILGHNRTLAYIVCFGVLSSGHYRDGTVNPKLVHTSSSIAHRSIIHKLDLT